MTLRVRLTAIAVLVVGLALVVGGFVLVTMLGSVLTDQVCTDARNRAAQLASVVATTTGTPPSTSSEIVEVIDSQGRVAGSPATAPLADPGAGCTKVEPPGHGEDFLFAAAPVPTAASGTGGPSQVVVGQPLVDVLDSTRFVTRVLLVGMPLVLLVVGLVTWFVAGRMLAPVTAIRREVDAISASELHRRVPATHSQDEIGRLAATMNRMLDRLQRAQDSQRRFVSDASHELRSPIASLRQEAEIALAHPDRSTLEHLADSVVADSLRLQRLVDDLLLLAKTDEREDAVPRNPVDLDDVVLAEVRRLKGTAEPAIDASAVSGGQVLGDPGALRRLVLNLLENAMRYARQRIVVGVLEERGEVVLRIEDDGPGIPPADRERVFERFVRLEAARGRDDGGSGLGLAIVDQVAQVHGGTVRIDESELGGAAFEVRLPAAVRSEDSD